MPSANGIIKFKIQSRFFPLEKCQNEATSPGQNVADIAQLIDQRFRPHPAEGAPREEMQNRYRYPALIPSYLNHPDRCAKFRFF